MLHIKLGKYGRAFFPKPSNPITKWILLRRGWKPYNENWWSKGNKAQEALERLYETKD
jgi:hypothetical protein